ncbi:MAG: hypothetical protein WKG03_08585 [Telluria sp.]
MSALKHAACAMLALAFTGHGAMAQEAPRQVEVKGIKDPQMRSYRSVWAGLDAFDKHRALAPQADPVRFRIKPVATNQDATIDGISLHIVGKGNAIPVSIDQGQFTIARHQAAYEDNADLMFNHKRHLFKTFAEVRTPGTPPNARRLGDLRLECQVNVAIVKKEAPLYIVAAASALFATTDWCKKLGIQMSLPTEQLSKVTMVHGERRKNVAPGELSMGALVDVSWPDDTLVEFEYLAGTAASAGKG